MVKKCELVSSRNTSPSMSLVPSIQQPDLRLAFDLVCHFIDAPCDYAETDNDAESYGFLDDAHHQVPLLELARNGQKSMATRAPTAMATVAANSFTAFDSFILPPG